MFLDILSEKQKNLLPLLDEFPEFYLVGRTAITLQIGHRESIDFDLFQDGPLKLNQIDRRFGFIKKSTPIVRNQEQYTFFIDDVKFTFFDYPFEIEHEVKVEGLKRLTCPNILDLASMKAYALGKRSKWKDYVDLYFIIKESYSIQEIIDRTKQIFKDKFNPRLFVEQLAFFKDINFKEEVIYKRDEKDYDEIFNFLTTKVKEFNQNS